jgi:DNA modification methylase
MANKRYYFYHSHNRKIIPVESEKLNIEAKKILKSIKNRVVFNTLPKEYQENWSKVSLFHPKGNIEKAESLILDPNNGSYSLKNKLNHLDGKEWTKFTKSWFIFDALISDLQEEKLVTQKGGLDSEEHPATYSPTMMESFIKFFSKEGDTILDPFSGIGSTLVACDRSNRKGVGVELNKKYCEIIKLRTQSKIINGDSKDIKKLLKRNKINNINFCISSPPYWDILNRSTGSFSKSRSKKDLDIHYSESLDDIGNISDYDHFLSILSNIYLDIYDFLQNGAYLVVIVKNLKKNGKHYPLAWDLAKNMEQKYQLKDEKIWCQDKVGLAPFGYPYAWTSNIVHHYCLIFRKDESKTTSQ